jgi:hypothetical protein
MNESKTKFDDEVDALYKLPLAEFTAARNALAKRLKQSGRGNEADFVKALAKPSSSAWAVNQLYWNHRDAFDRLIATGERFREAQTSRLSRKVADMRVALDARREALSHISQTASALLRDVGHNPTPDTMLRVTTTLEALSLYASSTDGPRPGRLTHDVDPPGFESLASFVPGAGVAERTKEPARVTPSQESGRAASARQEETRQARVVAAKVSLQEAKRSLTEARARAQTLEAAQKTASAAVKDAEKRKREAEINFDRARAALEEATRHAQSVAAEAAQAAKVVEDAKRTVENDSKELEKLFQESPAK